MGGLEAEGERVDRTRLWPFTVAYISLSPHWEIDWELAEKRFQGEQNIASLIALFFIPSRSHIMPIFSYILLL